MLLFLGEFRGQADEASGSRKYNREDLVFLVPSPAPDADPVGVDIQKRLIPIAEVCADLLRQRILPDIGLR